VTEVTADADVATKTVVLVGLSSGIGAALAAHYHAKGMRVLGTSRRDPTAYPLDVNNRAQIQQFRETLQKQGIRWNILILSVGVLEPIGLFLEQPFAAWEQAYRANALGQWEVLHALHDLRSDDATVFFFAGGAMNGVLERYSAYGVAKIALMKMTEYLHQEDPTTRYAIVGPGWVPTPIHEQTLRAGAAAGSNFSRTAAFLEQDPVTHADDAPIFRDIAACLDWITQQPRDLVGGRNFSVVHDAWGERPGAERLRTALATDPDVFRLRRAVPSERAADAV